MKLHLVALLSLWAAVSAPAGDLSSDVPIRSPDVRYGSEGTRSSALVTNERGCSGCSSLLYSYGENVVVELCVGAEPRRQHIVEGIDNRICDVIAGQERRREQHFSLGI